MFLTKGCAISVGNSPVVSKPTKKKGKQPWK